MNPQPKSRVLALPLGRRGNKQSKATAELTAPVVGVGLQSLAAELHQAAVKGVFEYRREVLMAAKVAMILFVVLPFFVLALTVIPAYQATGGLDAIVNWKTLGVLMAATIALANALFISALLPSIHVSPDGLGVHSILSKRTIPWKDVGSLRVMELRGSDRYVVMIPFKGKVRQAPMSSLIIALAGAGNKDEGGVLLTSDIHNFERLLQLIVAYMSQAAGQAVPAIEAFVDEEYVIPRAQLLLDPDAAFDRMARVTENDLDRYGIQKVEDDTVINWPDIIKRQVLVAAMPTLFMMVSVLMHSDERDVTPTALLWFGALLVFGVLELPFMAKLTQSVGDLAVGGGHFRRAANAYQDLQIPRALFVMGGIALLGMGLPSQVAQGFWMLGILITTFLTTRFVRRLYGIQLAPALMAGVGAFVYQATLFALYFGLR